MAKSQSVFFLLILLIVTQAVFADEKSIARGRYLSSVSGCNDCHTAGFAPSGGKIPEKDWLLGDVIGWKGEWGTTYAINLRKLVHALNKDQWIELCRNSKARPPMPSYIINMMHEEDLVALFDFIKSLGDGGKAAPAGLAPGVEPSTPYFNMVPLNLSP